MLVFANDEVSTPTYNKSSTQDIVKGISSMLIHGMMEFTMLKDDSLHLPMMPTSD